MDRKKNSLLKFLIKNCNGEYKIFETNKILKSLKKYKGDYNLFKKDIDYFSKRKYIDLKYIDEENVCLNLQDNIHVLEENLKVEERLSRKFVSMLTIFSCFSFGMAFLGSFLALLIFR